MGIEGGGVIRLLSIINKLNSSWVVFANASCNCTVWRWVKLAGSISVFGINCFRRVKRERERE